MWRLPNRREEGVVQVAEAQAAAVVLRAQAAGRMTRIKRARHLDPARMRLRAEAI